jgi:hypothetical protein
MLGNRAAVSAAFLILFPFATRGQSVRGVVVDLGDRPVPGVVVLLLDSVSHVTARALSNERGEFRVASSRPGTYHIRTLRIGFRPVTSAAIVLPTGAETAMRLALSGLPVALDTMRIADRNVCRAFTDSGAATYAVWEQIRTALIAAELTAASRTIAATTETFERALDPGPGRFTGRVLRQRSNVSTDYVSRIWRALPPDSLHRVGYVVTERDNSITYYAPDLAVLLSNQFVEDHCFRLTTDRNHSGLLGIAFEPTPERKKGAAEIRGTIWADRGSSELRQLEFRYVNVTREQEAEAGADLALVRMRDGAWAISRWNIRMPVVAEVVLPGRGTEPRITEIRVAGGELALARRGTDTLWRGPPRVLTGTLVDSLSGSPVADARVAVSGTTLAATSDARGRFTISGMLPGEYTLHVTTPSLDSLTAVHQSSLTFTDATTALEVRVPNGQQVAATLCGPATHAGLSGIVAGRVRLRGDSATATNGTRGSRIVAEWSADVGDSTRVRRLEVRAAPDGGFRLCAVPLNTAITLSATADSAETREASVVRIAPTARIARAELTLDRVDQITQRGATFSGIVVSDSTHEPIVGAEVAVSDVGPHAFTDAHGTFKLSGILPGEHRITVRRIGFGPAEARLAFRGNEIVERRVVLGRAVVLEPVTVTEKEIQRAMTSFEENRRVGLGHFMTRAQIAVYDGMKLAGVVQQMGGISVISGRTGSAWITSKHAPLPLCRPADTDCIKSAGSYVPEGFERLQGMLTACYSLVYLDGVVMNGSREPTEPFDINSIAPEQIEAMEFYAGSAETPLKYSRAGSNCGVLAIWRRRSP